MADYPTSPLPRFARLRQQLARDHLADVAGAVRGELERIRLGERIHPGDAVAITAGSRGIAEIPLILRTVADRVRRAGGEPFVVPAMGSHGGATVEGQRHVLAEYGITERSVGAPIRATMDTVELGRTANGARVYFDAHAAAAQATIVVNRVKAHTAFRGPIESGLCKMTCIGLGKALGAEQVHAHGLLQTIPQAASVTLDKANIVAGLAVVENAAHQVAVIRATPPEGFLQADRELLVRANDYLPRVPFDHLHVLVVGWCGKNLSGSGMDYNIVGMWRRIGGERVPDFERIVVLDLTDESDGNGLGVGIADFTTRRLFDKLDLPKMYLNGLTSGALGALKIPIVLDSDRQALQVALHSVGHGTDARVAIIRSTLELDELLVSEALLDEASRQPRLEQLGPAAELDLGPDGRLVIFSEREHVTSS